MSGANPAGGVTTYSNSKSIREDLEDIIYSISPMDTWCLTNFGRSSANATLHEWQIDSFAAAAANAHVEGGDFSAVTAAQTVRIKNYCQISKKEVVVSGTQQAVTHAGMRDMMAYQMMKKAKELKRDMEFDILQANSATAGGVASARVAASLMTFLETSLHVHGSTQTTGTTTGWSATGIPNSDPSAGSATALTEGDLKTALQVAWTNGGETDVILTSAIIKQRIDAMTGIATRFRDVASSSQAQIIGAADVFVSDYGAHKVVISRYILAGSVICLDSKQWAIGYLRPFSTVDIAKTGDSEKKMVQAEWTLVGKNFTGTTKLTGMN